MPQTGPNRGQSVAMVGDDPQTKVHLEIVVRLDESDLSVFAENVHAYRVNSDPHSANVDVNREVRFLIRRVVESPWSYWQG